MIKRISHGLWLTLFFSSNSMRFFYREFIFGWIKLIFNQNPGRFLIYITLNHTQVLLWFNWNYVPSKCVFHLVCYFIDSNKNVIFLLLNDTFQNLENVRLIISCFFRQVISTCQAVINICISVIELNECYVDALQVLWKQVLNICIYCKYDGLIYIPILAQNILGWRGLYGVFK